MRLSYLTISMIVKSFLGKFTGIRTYEGKNATGGDCHGSAAAAATALPAGTWARRFTVEALRLIPQRMVSV